jgi:hypothetical protein
VGLAKRGAYGEAAEKFRASYAIDPARGTLLGLAMAEQENGRLATALGLYQELLDVAKKAGDEARAGIAEKRIQQLTPRLPKLVVSVTGPVSDSTRVLLDGEELPRGAWRSELPVDPGEHELVLEDPAGEPLKRRVVVREGMTERVLLQAPAPTPAAEPAAPDDTQRARPWTPLRVAGVATGAAGLGVGVASALLWRSSGRIHDDLEADCRGDGCSASRRDDAQRGERQENLARGGAVLSGVLVVGGAALFVLGRPEKPRSAAWGVFLNARGAELQGRF